MRWYITVAAVHEFQRLAGLPIVDSGLGFDAPAKALSAICEDARLAKSEWNVAEQWKLTYRIEADDE